MLLNILLTGSSPFANREAAKCGQRMSTRGRLSREAEHLLDSCFIVDPERRITLEGIRAHPWVSARA